MMTTGPIFIAGLERSGTSLMYSLLASHPQIAMMRRTNLWRYFDGQFGDLSDNANLDACLAIMRRYKRLAVLDLDFDAIRETFLFGERSYARLFALIGEQHARRLAKPRWGDKSLNTELYATSILDAYPDARILHMVRDPRDRFASSVTRWKRRRGGVGAGTAEWRTSVRLAEGLVAARPGQYRIVRYEDLVCEPGVTLREICTFIGETYSPEMFSMSGAPSFRLQGGNSSYGRRRVGVISTESMGRFHDVLTPTQIAFIELLAGPEMTRLGYALEHEPMALASQVRFVAARLPLEGTRMLAWSAAALMRRHTRDRLPERRLVDAGAVT